jgi:hypothetical protein
VASVAVDDSQNFFADILERARLSIDRLSDGPWRQLSVLPITASAYQMIRGYSKPSR